MLRKNVLRVVALGAAGVVLGALFFWGYTVGRYEFVPFDLVRSAEKKILGDSLDPHDEEWRTKQFSSIFVRLVGESTTVPVERKGAGGSLASFGDAVLVLTHEGKIFAARSVDEIRETSIETPDNGYSAYVKAAESERLEGYTHNFENFRYNDILHYQNDSEQGLVLSYTEFDEAESCYGNTVAVLKLDPAIRVVEDVSARREDWNVIHRTQPCLPLKKEWRAIEGHMAGGRMAFRAPSTVFLASGDYAWDGVYAPEAIAQDPDKEYGKILAIDLVSGQARIVSTGSRNVQGLSFDADGRLWAAEHGPRGGDELNLVVEGANFGWPEETLGTLYSMLPFPNTRSYGRHEFHTAPTFAWLPGIATSSLTLIENFHDSWDGDLLLASLKAQSLFRIRVKGDRVLFVERVRIRKRIRYALQHDDGRLVLWTDDHHLIFLSVAPQSFANRFIERYFDKADYTEAQRSQVEVALGSCRECHSFDPGDHEGAPSLASMFNAPIAATSFSDYSDVLKARGGRWSREELMAYLQDTEGYAPGTTMPNPEIDDPFVLEELINLMEAVSTTAE